MANQKTSLLSGNALTVFPSSNQLLCSLAILLSSMCSQALYAATITQTQFLGVSNIIDRDVSCTGPTNGSIGGCFAQGMTIAKQASQVFGPIFDRFDRSLGTLNNVNLSYNIETGGTWISRPENSQLSISTDFSYSSQVGLDWLWALPGSSSIRQDRIQVGSTDGDFNYRVNEQIDSWAVTLRNSIDYLPSDEDPFRFFTYDGVTDQIWLQLFYSLTASLDGRGADCAIGTAPCGTTNRITFLRSTRFSLTYDYTPTGTDPPPPPVPLPSAFWFFGSAAVMGVGLIRRKRE